MKGRIIEQYLQTKVNSTEPEAPDESESFDDLGAFGFLRGTHDRALMLELRRKDGTITAYPYAWLSKTAFNPSEGITLYFGAEAVKVCGRNLNAPIRPNVRLFAAIVRQRVPWIQESNEPSAMAAPKSAVVIERIEIKPIGTGRKAE
jgi:hypothetical protein